MSKHNVRGTASGEYECSCGARWDRDEGDECPLGRIDGKQVAWQNETMENARVAALNGTLPEPKEVVGAGDREALIYLMERFDNEVWICPRCSHEEPTNDMDSASYLREYLAGAQPDSAGDDRVREALRECLEVMELHRLTGQVYANGRAALSANHSEKQAKDAPYMSDDADPRETWAEGYNAAMRNA